jgi:hypothetical protein
MTRREQMLTDRDREGLKMMCRCIFDEMSHEKVRSARSGKSGLRFAVSKLKDFDTVWMYEQNPNRGTIFADAARNGIDIAWVFKDGGYAGPVVARLDGLTFEVYDTGDDLRVALNPLGYMDRSAA